MSIDKLKNKFSTGAFVADVKHYFSKINEIIDWINNIGSTAVPDYKEYIAILTQSGTNAPNATVLVNTLGGDIVWTRLTQGYYVGTLTGAFTRGKTLMYGPTDQKSNATSFYTITYGSDDVDTIFVSPMLYSAGTISSVDDYLPSSTNPSTYGFIHVKVYN